MASIFEHGLVPGFIEKLTAEAERASWWADVLGDASLYIALRGSYLNVYWRGQSLFWIGPTASGLKVTTHAKYLVDPELADQVSLTGRDFDVQSLREIGFIRQYKDRSTINKMKKTAALFSGLEKSGCHEIAVNNPGVIDCEIAFSDGKRAPRVDLAAVEPFGDAVRLAFWEAKDYSNGELRASDGLPRVYNQVKSYEKILSDHRDAIEESYAKVAANLVEIHKMGWQRPLRPLIADVAAGRRLTLGPQPEVGLAIFGFDRGQRDDAGWKVHLGRLTGNIERVRAVGNAKTLRI